MLCSCVDCESSSSYPAAKVYQPEGTRANWKPLDGALPLVLLVILDSSWLQSLVVRNATHCAVSRLTPPDSFALPALDGQRSPAEAEREPRSTPLRDYPPFDPEQDARTYRLVDEHAVAVSRTRFATARALVYALVYARGLDDDFERARCAPFAALRFSGGVVHERDALTRSALYTWFAHSDLRALRFGDARPGSLEQHIESIVSANQNLT